MFSDAFRCHLFFFVFHWFHSVLKLFVVFATVCMFSMVSTVFLFFKKISFPSRIATLFVGMLDQHGSAKKTQPFDAFENDPLSFTGAGILQQSPHFSLNVTQSLPPCRVHLTPPSMATHLPLDTQARVEDGLCDIVQRDRGQRDTTSGAPSAPALQRLWSKASAIASCGSACRNGVADHSKLPRCQIASHRTP